MVKATDGASSDDEVYDAVDLISESEDDDECTVERNEEREIISSLEETDATSTRHQARPSRQSALDERTNPGRDEAIDHGTHGSELHGVVVNTHFAGEMESFALANVLDRAVSEAVSEPKRVRFQESVVRTSAASEDDDDDVNPFLSQEQLDPDFRSLIENDDEDDEDDGSQGDGASDQGDEEWLEKELRAAIDDGTYDDGPLEGGTFEDGTFDDGAFVTDSEDEGETTDEDLPPPECIARTRSVLRRMSGSSTEANDEDRHRSSTMRRPTKRATARRLGPSLGSWVADPSKPIAIVDSSARRILIYPALTPRQGPQDIFGAPTSSGTSTVTGSPHTPAASSRRAVRHDSPNLALQNLTSPTLSVGASSMGALLRRSEYHIAGPYADPHHHHAPFMDHPDPVPAGRNQHWDFGNDDDWNSYVNMRLETFIDFGDDTSDDDDNDHDDHDEQQTPSKGGGGDLIPSDTTIHPTSRKRALTAGSGASHSSKRTASPTSPRKRKQEVNSHKRIKSA